MSKPDNKKTKEQIREEKNVDMYIRLAHHRNQLFEKLLFLTNQIMENSTQSISSSEWEKQNQAALSVHNSIIEGLSFLGEKKRASLYKSISEIFYKTREKEKLLLTSKSLQDFNEHCKILDNCIILKNASDFLKTTLEVNFFEEFPNEFISNFILNHQNKKEQNDEDSFSQNLDWRRQLFQSESEDEKTPPKNPCPQNDTKDKIFCQENSEFHSQNEISSFEKELIKNFYKTLETSDIETEDFSK